MTKKELKKYNNCNRKWQARKKTYLKELEQAKIADKKCKYVEKPIHMRLYNGNNNKYKQEQRKIYFAAISFSSFYTFFIQKKKKESTSG